MSKCKTCCYLMNNGKCDVSTREDIDTNTVEECNYYEGFEEPIKVGDKVKVVYMIEGANDFSEIKVGDILIAVTKEDKVEEGESKEFLCDQKDRKYCDLINKDYCIKFNLADEEKRNGYSTLWSCYCSVERI